VRVLNDWARLARGKTPEGEEPPWSARNFFPYWLVPGSQHVRAEGGGRGGPEHMYTTRQKKNGFQLRP
jgi:hypothetical protein